MEYSIGEVSRMLGISREMIRYYEHSGAVAPHRNKENNYRSYDVFDVFNLMEVMQYKGFGIPIKEIAKMKECDFTARYLAQLQKYGTRLDEQISYETMLLRRIRQKEEDVKTCLLNVGNYWVKSMPARVVLPIYRGNGDEYGKINITGKMRQTMLSDSNLPFSDSAVFFRRDYQDWTMVMDAGLFARLGLPVLPDMYSLPSGFCLCTVVDMGRPGSFSSSVTAGAAEYADRAGLSPAGDMVGILIGRGNENGAFLRLMELQIPIATPRSESPKERGGGDTV